MDSGLERELRDDLGFGGGELDEAPLDLRGFVISAGQLSEELRVPAFGFGQVRIEALQARFYDVFRQKLQTFVGASLDQPEEQQSIHEPSSVRSRQGQQFPRVGIAAVAA